MLTGDPTYVDQARNVQASPLREGGGRIDLPRANTPLVFASPSSLSFGLMKPGTTKALNVALTDAGGGAGTWSVSFGDAQGTRPSAPASVTVPGTLTVTATVAAGAAEGDGTGFVVLTRGADTRRVAYWLHVERPRLGKPARTLTRGGMYSGNTRKGSARVSTYRYPEGSGATSLPGPEQVFAVRLKKVVSNFGVRIVSKARGVKVTPRVVRDDDENRLTGAAGLPGDLNPYRRQIGAEVPVVGAILPGRGTYDVVFDTTSKAVAGKFTFRLWINDVTPPRVRLLGYSRGAVRLAVADSGSGVDPTSLVASIDGRAVPVRFAKGKALIDARSLGAGRHTVRLSVADYQETKNMEDVLRIRPNTRDFTASFKVP
jgi:hypothetical protein